jgi:hypothetical protein
MPEPLAFDVQLMSEHLKRELQSVKVVSIASAAGVDFHQARFCTVFVVFTNESHPAIGILPLVSVIGEACGLLGSDDVSRAHQTHVFGLGKPEAGNK